MIDTTAPALIYKLREVGGSICTDGTNWQLHLPPSMPIRFVELLQAHALLISAQLYFEQKATHGNGQE